eukprot:TRINITY_DN10803_c0_g1_i6.p1 TRINITY_DN10803_c0_g1~~TRINITY_DN10803_c0_g1_i6.p1  ORF type:complete len:345 (-),score=50.94 TRINITY_DN10803_c0_g1_i6:47-1081(-)
MSQQDDSMLVEHKETKLGVFKTYFILVLAFVGVGVMHMPYYYKTIGLVLPVIITLFAAFFVAFGLKRLVECNLKNRVGYYGLAEMAFGKPAEIAAYIWIFIGQTIYGIAHLAYIVCNISSMIRHSGKVNSETGLTCIAGGILALIVPPLLCIKKWKSFPLFFAAASILTLCTLFSFVIPITFSSNRIRFTPFASPKSNDVAQFLGAIFFSLQGYATVIPTHRGVRLQGGYKMVLYFAIITACVMNIFVGLMLSIESNTESGAKFIVDFAFLVNKIKLNPTAVYILLSVYLICLIPMYYLAMYPVLRISEKALKQLFKDKGDTLLLKNSTPVSYTHLTLPTICSV